MFVRTGRHTEKRFCRGLSAGVGPLKRVVDGGWVVNAKPAVKSTTGTYAPPNICSNEGTYIHSIQTARSANIPLYIMLAVSACVPPKIGKSVRARCWQTLKIKHIAGAGSKFMRARAQIVLRGSRGMGRAGGVVVVHHSPHINNVLESGANIGAW